MSSLQLKLIFHLVRLIFLDKHDRIPLRYSKTPQHAKSKNVLLGKKMLFEHLVVVLIKLRHIV